ncbi:alpha/beta-hydrolase [Glonium stellatum]|uniref:Alpha/beta-hydrolase n=1 Tax=Glonium stellatum TaxID=574774 RepID=A0A8E2F2T5_9PEZI|nr:alpha/beta-hydrolase [Glonium stellatum]
MDDIESQRASIATNDGITISYIRAGAGPDLLFIPGWSQTAVQWRKQLVEFSQNYRVTAVDMRGHGESEKPNYGYRISRLAADIHDIINRLDLRDVTVIAHSMGCSIMWSYWDSFPHDRITKLVLVDQPALMITDPTWEDGIASRLGTLFTPAAMFDYSSKLRSSDGAAVSAALLASMKTPAMSNEDFSWIMKQNLKMPREHAATLLINHATADWRDVLPRITVPTLVIGGSASLAAKSGIEWVASQIPGAKLRIFSENEAGSHFMFWENPSLFNTIVNDFIKR